MVGRRFAILSVSELASESDVIPFALIGPMALRKATKTEARKERATFVDHFSGFRLKMFSQRGRISRSEGSHLRPTELEPRSISIVFLRYSMLVASVAIVRQVARIAADGRSLSLMFCFLLYNLT